nr:hypothetical protein [Deinococcus cavernae]
MTTKKTYTAEFKRQAIELAARDDVGPSGPPATLESAPPCCTAGDSRLNKQGKLPFLVRVERPKHRKNRKFNDSAERTKFSVKSVKS